MKKIGLILIGLLIAIPLSALAFVLMPSFPDVDQNAWYAQYVNKSNLAGWMNGYSNGNFGPENAVLRGELAKIISNYDKNMEQMHDQLKDIICLNKGQSLNELGLKVADQNKYSQALKNFCGGQWPGQIGCSTPYDSQKGEYQTKFTVCP